MKSYTTTKKVIEFEVDGEQFRTIPSVPAGLIFDLGALGTNREATEGFFEAVLDEESFPRFMARYRDKTNPIDMATVNKIIEDLQEDVTNRPTELSSGSPAGSSPTTGSSTASAPTAASTP